MSVLSRMEKSQVEFLLKDNNDATVAEQFGVTRQAVYHVRKKFNIPSSRRYSLENIKKIIELRAAGTPVQKIATIVNMSHSYVYKILRGVLNG